MQHLLVRGNRQRPRRLDHPFDIARADLFVLDRHNAVGVEARDVRAGDAGEHRVNLAAGHELGLLDRALDRLHRGLDIHHHALLHAARRVVPDADDLDLARGANLGHDREHLGSTDVEAHNQFFVVFLCHA